MTHDEALVELIRSAVLKDGRLSSQPLDISVRDGRVWLKGSVQSFSRKRTADEIVGDCDGVLEVFNQLEVVSPGPTSDAQIAEAVRAALEAHPDITKEAITVSVDQGIVTLRGNTTSESGRLLAEDVAIAATGVRGIHNLLFSNSTERTDDVAFAREILTAIHLTHGLSDVQVRVAVAGNTVVLSGRVGASWQKRRAGSIAMRFRLNHLRNEILVEPGST